MANRERNEGMQKWEGGVSGNSYLKLTPKEGSGGVELQGVRQDSLLAHASDVDDLLEGLDGVLENGLNRLHDSESSLHVVDLGLHALNGLHLSGDLNEGLSVIESLEDSSGESLLDVLDGSGLGNGGISVSSGLRSLGGREGGGELSEELVLSHEVVLVGGDGGEGGESEEFHFNYL